jgi:hypothetical protein
MLRGSFWVKILAPEMIRGFCVFAGVFEGCFGKTACWMWFFGGEIVVDLW